MDLQLPAGPGDHSPLATPRFQKNATGRYNEKLHGDANLKNFSQLTRSKSTRVIDVKSSAPPGKTAGISAFTAASMMRRAAKAKARSRGDELLARIFARIENKAFRPVEIFFRVDADASGSLNIGEFEEALELMEIELPYADLMLAFKELDADGSGDIEIEEFMERMRAEKKWRMRAAMAKTAKAERHDEVTMQALTAQTKCERDAIIEGHAKSEWDRAVMKATLMAWGQGSMTGQGMDDDERQWRQREEQAVMAEMAAEKEEQEAREAEVAYDKEELEAIHAEAEFQRECAEAREAIADAIREEAEAIEAIAVAAKEEAEAVAAEKMAAKEQQEAIIAKKKLDREQMKMRKALAEADRQQAEVAALVSELKVATMAAGKWAAKADTGEGASAGERVAALEATLAERTAAAEAARAAAVQQQGEAAIAAKESDKEMKEAVKAQVVAQRERAESEVAKANAQREQQEAVEARVTAEREMSEMVEARKVAERERAEAEEARAVMEKEQAEAKIARGVARAKRAEASALKEVWAQRKASEQAAKWAAKRDERRKAAAADAAIAEAKRKRAEANKAKLPPPVFGETRLWSRSGKRKPPPPRLTAGSDQKQPQPDKPVFLSPRALVTQLVSTDPWFCRNEAGGNGSWTDRGGTAQNVLLAARRTQSLPPKPRRHKPAPPSGSPRAGEHVVPTRSPRALGLRAPLRKTGGLRDPDIGAALSAMGSVRAPVQLRRVRSDAPRPTRDTHLTAAGAIGRS